MVGVHSTLERQVLSSPTLKSLFVLLLLQDWDLGLLAGEHQFEGHPEHP